MKYRIFNKLGVSPSMLGFGCMRFPLNEDGTINEKEAEAMIDKAIANGVTYIDTAYPYHNGDSEPFVGRVLKKYNREDYFLATKLPVWNVKTKEDVQKIFLEQLERLDQDHIDFYLLHALDQEKWNKVLELDILHTIEDLRDEGKIKYIGFSFHDEYNVFEQILDYYPWDFCQLQLNYMDMDIQAGMKGYELAEKKGVPIVVMEPIKGGSLASLPDDVAQLLKNAHPDASLSSWALRYIGTLPNVKVILSGMSTMQHVDDNLETFRDFKVLNEEELKIINQVQQTLKAKTKNGCTGCAYCMPCPFGVDIPSNFKYWNNCSIYDDPDTFQTKWNAMADEKKADQCKQCGKCETMCPQHIQIREDLKHVVEDMKK